MNDGGDDDDDDDDDKMMNWINHSISHTVRESITHSVNQLINQLIKLTMNHSCVQFPTDRPIDRLNDQPINKQINLRSFNPLNFPLRSYIKQTQELTRIMKEQSYFHLPLNIRWKSDGCCDWRWCYWWQTGSRWMHCKWQKSGYN